MYLKLLLLSASFSAALCAQDSTTQLAGRSTIVHLFEWKWKDIADECERFLGPKGFGGVQVSPPSENVIIHVDGARTWYERYQVMSYKIQTRSGSEEDFLNMTRRCNKVGVRIYADVVVNHMTGDNSNNVGTGGSSADFQQYDYPGVPYRREHFHYPYCNIGNYNNATENHTTGDSSNNVGTGGSSANYRQYDYPHYSFCGIVDCNNATEVRDCQLVGLKDLNQSQKYVREKIVNYFNKLISLGVAGLRVDAAKHMWPSDLKEIYKRVSNLNPEFFKPNSRPYIYQEVIYYGGEAIRSSEYTSLGAVTEFRVGNELKNVFRGRNALKWLVNWGPAWGLLPSGSALVFIDNHDTQRSGDVLTYKESRAYKAAIAFMLAHPYGEPRVMSSFYFENSNQGPPSDYKENILSPIIYQNDTCGNGWVCEHRWRQIYQMVGFRNAAGQTTVQNWWDNGNNQIAFSRGSKAFIVFNLEGRNLDETLQTGLPPGEYCDVITGKRQGGKCTGNKVAVDHAGRAAIHIPSNAEDVHLAIHVGPQSSLKSSAAAPGA